LDNITVTWQITFPPRESFRPYPRPEFIQYRRHTAWATRWR